MSDGVIVANNMKASVVAKGNVTIKAISGDATDVLCIPELTMNLWSMHKVCSRGHRVVFYKDVFWIGLWHLYTHSLKQLRNMVGTWCEARRIRYSGLHSVPRREESTSTVQIQRNQSSRSVGIRPPRSFYAISRIRLS